MGISCLKHASAFPRTNGWLTVQLVTLNTSTPTIWSAIFILQNVNYKGPIYRVYKYDISTRVEKALTVSRDGINACTVVEKERECHLFNNIYESLTARSWLTCRNASKIMGREWIKNMNKKVNFGVIKWRAIAQGNRIFLVGDTIPNEGSTVHALIVCLLVTA